MIARSFVACRTRRRPHPDYWIRVPLGLQFARLNGERFGFLQCWWQRSNRLRSAGIVRVAAINQEIFEPSAAVRLCAAQLDWTLRHVLQKFVSEFDRDVAGYLNGVGVCAQKVARFICDSCGDGNRFWQILNRRFRRRFLRRFGNDVFRRVVCYFCFLRYLGRL